jgi:hypothetical protein
LQIGNPAKEPYLQGFSARYDDSSAVRLPCSVRSPAYLSEHMFPWLRNPVDTPATSTTLPTSLVRAAGLARAFLLLEEDTSGPRVFADGVLEHPHRQPMRASGRPRRPGAGSPRAQVCLTPVVPEPAIVAGRPDTRSRCADRATTRS